MITVINILSIFNLIALAFLIGIRKQNLLANRVLALTLVCSATDFVVNFLSYNGQLKEFYYTVFFNFSFLWSPLVALYVMLMLEIKIKFHFKHLIHLVPQVLSWAYWLYVMVSGEEYSYTLLENRKNGIYTWQLQSFQMIIILQAIIYFSYSARLINSKQSEISHNLSSLKIQWLKQFIYILSGLIFLLLIFSFFITPVTIDYIIAPILYGISNVFLVYKGLGSSGIFNDTVFVGQSVLFKERYTGSNLKPEQVLEYKIRLQKYMNEKEPYTNPELTLNTLAANTDIQIHHLSQVINQEFKMNFFDLVNSYRIEKSKSLMKDSENGKLTLEAIGLKSGFGSASSFYRSFKKQTGITPNAFLKAQGRSYV